jgi:hypothetical protein
MTAAYTFIGTTDEVTTCGCCGRSDLKGTIVLQAVDGGEFVFFGSTCGEKAQGWTVKDFNAAAKQADDDRKAAIKAFEFNHPLTKVINDEIAAANDHTPRMPYADRRVWMIRWQELRTQIAADSADKFAIV